jgi:hypothetical protein
MQAQITSSYPACQQAFCICLLDCDRKLPTTIILLVKKESTHLHYHCKMKNVLLLFFDIK